jgi:hypothetical protein
MGKSLTYPHYIQTKGHGNEFIGSALIRAKNTRNDIDAHNSTRIYNISSRNYAKINLINRKYVYIVYI